MTALIWLLVVTMVGLAVFFRSRRWLRVVSVIVMLGLAELASTGVTTSHRLAIEKAGIRTYDPQDRFVEGSGATQRIAVGMMTITWAVVLGLAVLALIPSKPSRSVEPPRATGSSE